VGLRLREQGAVGFGAAAPRFFWLRRQVGVWYRPHCQLFADAKSHLQPRRPAAVPHQ
jgi:hypothetical protein